MTTEQMIEVYGLPNKTGKGYLELVNIPYPMRLAWDTGISVKRISCHKLVVEDIINVFEDIESHYGYDRLKELGIDLYGGMFMYRPKRGKEKSYIAAIEKKDYVLASKYLSTHSWGTSIDLDPARNLLWETSGTARFARDEYSVMIDIFECYGFESLGRKKNYDWMHFQKTLNKLRC